ncbi:MAG: zinc ribbon domain-containing protein [Treponema sp.]|jgi:predicted RNA-binding Zn-ribbon protein involved in translation (DUF1610 family)|nr:zinc ribbon domain-containing protein [Treponema sp.]
MGGPCSLETMSNPSFFCENCGAEVPLRAKDCPRCGRTFLSVRCPSCGFTGEETLFDQGCPACGYKVPSGAERKGGGGKKKKAAPEALPMWVYLFASVVFTGICVILLALLNS